MSVKIPFDCDKVRVTSPYGNRTLNGTKQFHGGYDLVGVGSTNICAVVGGTVVHSRMITDKSNPTWQWGNYVCIRGTDDRLYYYCHMQSRSVKPGDTVHPGDKLGVMGNTGYSFGAHLHFEVREGSKAINPEEILGIANKTGTYSLPKISDYEKAINILCEKGVINTPEYWLKREKIDPYFAELIKRVAKKLQ